MTQKVSVGGEDFASLRKSGSYYVDKTELLYDLVHETDNVVTLFTRPRRFGKTLTMSMMESFFNVEKKEEKGAFDGLRIMKHREFCNAHMNRYPVIFISLKGVEGTSFEPALQMLRTKIADLCRKIAWLGDAEAVSPFDKEIFERLQRKTEEVDEIKNALKTIMRMLFDFYGKKVILLIDEYDVPLAKAEAGNYYRPMLDIIRGLMDASLKTNEYLAFAVITGCLRIPKESIFTGVNNFASYSVLDDRFSQYFGFTGAEVNEMLAVFGLKDKAEIMRSWYDGYTFGRTQVYCPWDVVNYISDLQYDRDSVPQNYWENTSGNDAIRNFFEMKDVDYSDKFEILLNGGTSDPEQGDSGYLPDGGGGSFSADG